MKILDTHVGSGSSRIAAYKHKLDFIGYELDEEYWNAQEKRFAQYKSQLTLW
jgi:site-specific DNA-methyltransferase (adenine-specific)